MLQSLVKLGFGGMVFGMRVGGGGMSDI